MQKLNTIKELVQIKEGRKLKSPHDHPPYGHGGRTADWVPAAKGAWVLRDGCREYHRDFHASGKRLN
jgi:hypothetical protein